MAASQCIKASRCGEDDLLKFKLSRRPHQVPLLSAKNRNSWHPVWSSAVVAHLLQGSTCCVFRDGILHTLVVTSGYLPFYNLSHHSPLTSDINKAFSSTQLPLTGYFFFFEPFSVNPRDFISEKIPEDQQFLKHSDQPVWHQQPFHIQSNLNPLSSPFWCSVWTSANRLQHI